MIIQVAMSFNVDVDLRGSKGKQLVDLYVDFGFDNVLISKSSITCEEDLGCKEIDPEQKRDMYGATEYLYSLAEVKFYLKTDEDSYEEVAVQVRLTNMNRSVIGINSTSSIAKSVNIDKQWQLDLLNKDIQIISDDFGKTNMKEYRKNEINQYIIDSRIVYSVSDSYGGQIDQVVAANICLNRPTRTGSEDYFFAGGAYFYEDWEQQLSNIEARAILGVSLNATVYSKDDLKSNGISFDNVLFDNYDYQPMKTYVSGYLDQPCELFLGDFAVHRSQLKIYLATAFESDKLDVGYTTETQAYIAFNKSYIRFFVYVIIIASLVYLGYLCFWSSYKRSSSMERGDYYETINN